MTDATRSDVDLGLALPLHGVQLLEASAGTGKTYTIATLYARWVVEAGLPVEQLLAVTFTEAATRALRETLRARLAQVRDLLDAGDCGAAPHDDATTQLAKALLRTALAREPLPALRARLRRAVERLDLAPIHTIHAFCQRALAEHALDAGHPLAPRTVVANEAALRHEVALEFWRLRSRAPADADALLAVWSSPDALAKSLRDLLAFDVLEPTTQAETIVGATLVAKPHSEHPEEGFATKAAPTTAEAAMRAARATLAAAFATHGDTARELLRAACAGGHVSKTYSKDSAVDPVWQALRAWAADPLDRDPDVDAKKLGNYRSTCLRANTNKKGVTPQSPLFDAIDGWHAARLAADAALAAAKLATVHAAVGFARARLAALKRERGLLGYDDMIADVADALAGPAGERFAARLQAQYRVALLDEFQDTDPRQWAIFRRLFATPAAGDEGDRQEAFAAGAAPTAPRALVLIGDPKQAIYRFRGGDVATYLAAHATADGHHSLRRNFRSRPRALAAVEALFTLRGPGAFAQAGIEFVPVAAGPCPDAALRIDDADATGLWVQQLATPGDAPVDAARDEATAACVAAIHALLSASAAGRATLLDQKGVVRPVAPGDLTVLVPRNKDAQEIRAALAAAGIPCAATGRDSLYQTEEAQHVSWLLAALAAPADDGRLRAALATPLFGLDAARIAALDTDLAAHDAWQDRLQHWQQHVRRHGAVALLGAICADQAPRLRAWPDGERRLGNYLQLAEELQAVAAPGPAALRVELERRIADADPANEAEWLRLDADAARVRILTQHVSKGLTLDVVFLPYAGIRKGNGAQRKPDFARTSDGVRRVGHLYPAKGDAACVEEAREEHAEQVRLLYVGLTRARLATWVAWGAVKEAHRSALGWLLHRPADGGAVAALTEADVAAGLRELQALAPGAIEVRAPSTATPSARWLPPAPTAAPSPRIARRVLHGDWWVYSFSQLTRETGGGEPRGADDEPETGPPERSRFAGARFGNALHGALERVDFAAWRDWRDGPLPPGQQAPLEQALRDTGYATAADLDEGVPLLAKLVAETLNAPLPEGTRLADVDPTARVVEMEFHLALAPLDVETLLARLHAHGHVAQRRGFGARARLAGLLTGRIDLVYAAGDRFFVVDYKSNRLADYGAATLERAVRDSEYDLQYVIYTLALHRWLRFRLGAAYDPARHLGGVRYLFCRGLDRDDQQAPGVHAPVLPVALVEDLDALLRGAAA